MRRLRSTKNILAMRPACSWVS